MGGGAGPGPGWRRISLAVLVACVLPTLAGSSCAGEPAEGWLRDWLRGLTLRAPPIALGAGGFDALVDALTCTDLDVATLRAAHLPPQRLRVAATFAGTCAANWSFHLHSPPHWPKGRGTVEARASNATSLTATLVLSAGSDGLPASAALSECNSVVEVASLAFGGGVEAKVLNLFRPQIEAAVKDNVGAQICASLSELVAVNLTAALRAGGAVVAPHLQPRPPRPPPLMPRGSIDWTRSTPVKLARFAVADMVGVSGNFSVNRIVDWLLPAGAVGTPVNATVSFAVPSAGAVTLTLQAVDISGLDTATRLDAPVPADAEQLAASYTLGHVHANASVQLLVQPDGASVAGRCLKEEAQVSVALRDVSLQAMVAAGVNGADLGRLQVEQLAASGCVLGAVGPVVLTDLMLGAVVEYLGLRASSGGDLEREMDELVRAVLELVVHDYGDVLSLLANGLSSGPLRDTASDLLDDELARARKAATACPRPDTGAHVDYGRWPHVALTFSAALFVAAAVVSAVGAVVAAWERIYRARPAAPALPPVDVQGEGLNLQAPLLGHLPKGGALRCTAASPLIPTTVSVGIALTLLATMLLFLSSNLSVGAEVRVSASLRGAGGAPQTVELPAVFSFSLGNSVRDMWNAHTYSLAVLIAVFSGGWPYLKLALMLVAWLAPLPRRKAEELLIALDALGKWSLVDTFVMVLFMVAFRFHLASPTTHSLAESIDVVVVPLWGFFAFLVATILSLVTTHVVLALHRRVMDAEGEGTATPSASVMSLPDAAAEADDGATGEDSDEDDGVDIEDTLQQQIVEADLAVRRRVCSDVPRTVAVGVTAMLLACGAVVFWGCSARSFSFEFRGLAGFVLGPHAAVRPYSLLSLARGVVAPVGDLPAPPGTRWLEVVLLGFTAVALAAQFAALLTLWVAPMTRRAQRRVFVLAETVNAYAALDVFAVSIIAAVLDIGEFSQFIVGRKCDAVNALLRQYLDPELHGDDRCFDVRAELDAGAWALFAAALASFATAQVVTRSAEAALRRAEPE